MTRSTYLNTKKMSTIFHGLWFFSIWGLASNKWKMKCNFGMPDDIINQICTIFPHITFNFQGKYFRLYTFLRKICVCVINLIEIRGSFGRLLLRGIATRIMKEFRNHMKKFWPEKLKHNQEVAICPLWTSSTIAFHIWYVSSFLV